MFPERRVWCVFQPHQISRTGRLLDEFAAALQNADRVSVAEIYRAREPLAATGAAAAAELAAAAGKLGVEVVGERALGDISERLCGELKSGDVLVTLGAGDIRKVCDDVVDRLRIDRAAS
jgi:UDP-N-acetylmuramate--alanine ligase